MAARERAATVVLEDDNDQTSTIRMESGGRRVSAGRGDLRCRRCAAALRAGQKHVNRTQQGRCTALEPRVVEFGPSRGGRRNHLTDYVRHDPGDPFPARGPEDVKRIVTMLRTMLPDFRIQVEAVIAEGDIVVSRYTATATDTVGYMGMPPTGSPSEPQRCRCSAFHRARLSRAGPRGTTWERCVSWATWRSRAVLRNAEDRAAWCIRESIR